MMKLYHIDIDTVMLEANSEEEAEKLFMQKIEDPFFCIDVLKNYDVSEASEM